tara:strand:+ start:4276 stop:4788 length:513 start_codon:yes stop_codon:yes gene_type:complete
MRGKRNYMVRDDVPLFQKHLPIKKCNRCAKVLVVPDTWCVGNERKRNYICKVCDIAKGAENRLKRLARSIHSRALREYNKAKDGYVYIISNPAWKGWYKVGMAIDAEDRLKSYQTSSPRRDYKLEYCRYFLDRRQAEEETHSRLDSLSIDRNGEWFKVNLISIQKTIGDI